MLKNNDAHIRADILICLFLVVVLLILYWQVRNHNFIHYDDNAYITQNYYVQNGLAWEGIVWAFTAFHASNWHPLTWISHMMDCQFYGLNSGRHHLTNVLFHLMNTLLLFSIFLKMTGYIWRSGFIAALFGLHPLHVESVAWVSERKDVLSAFFFMLTICAYIWYSKHPGWRRYLLVLLFFVMGLMSKPMLVTLPCVLLLLDYWPLGRFTSSGLAQEEKGTQQWALHKGLLWLLWEKIPLFICAIAACIVTFFAQQSGESVASLELLPLPSRIANALISYVRYILKMVFPSHLAIIYPYSRYISAWQCVLAGVFLFTFSLLIIVNMRKHPYCVMGWLWYMGTLVPVIGFVQVGMQSMADRYTYIPLIGLFIMIAWGVPELFARWRLKNRVLIIIATLCISILMVTSYVQVGYWINDVTLFKHAIDVTSHNYLAHHFLGFALLSQGNIKEATHHYFKALSIKPDYAEAHNNLGIALERQGQVTEATSHYFEALRIDPDYANPHGNLGVIFARQKNYQKAIFHFREALRIKPDYINVHYNLGLALVQQGSLKEAVIHLEEALRLKPHIACANHIKARLIAVYEEIGRCPD